MAAATMVIALGAAIAVSTQQAEAARSGPQWLYCYNFTDPATGLEDRRCWSNNGECHQGQRADTRATSGCYRFTVF